MVPERGHLLEDTAKGATVGPDRPEALIVRLGDLPAGVEAQLEYCTCVSPV